ncbi:DUF1850 domain-containing protein [Nocardiopsis sp. CC223A]|uniref:DUF1850 domain-containing protein n=1 Tax=Nocardiopsis sp. CC223A TaxID=3044051 RepID=UPI00278BF806|nr:DUF1850 domain-containing protein [Nocardiopsis sp. CC223A]
MTEVPARDAAPGTAGRPRPTHVPGEPLGRDVRTALAATVAAAVLAALAALAWPVHPALRIADEGAVIGHLPLAAEEVFTIAYVHSIDGLPIEEDIAVRDGRLVVDATRIRQFGAGMGQIPGEGRGRADGRWWVIEDMNRDIGTELAIRVGSPAVDHRLRTPGAEVRLSPCLTAHRVTVEPVRLSALHFMNVRTPAPEC